MFAFNVVSKAKITRREKGGDHPCFTCASSIKFCGALSTRCENLAASRGNLSDNLEGSTGAGV